MPLLTKKQTDTVDIAYLISPDLTDEAWPYQEYESGETVPQRWRCARAGRGGIESESGEVMKLPPNTTTYSSFVTEGPPWLGNALRKLEELRRYAHNWDSYQSPPISEIAYARARAFLLSLGANIPSPIIVPVPGGGIQFEWQVNRQELEIELHPDGRIEYLRVFADEATDEGPVPSMTDPILRDLFGWLLSD
jgi:hypothetical protein